jgi:hypothetical protein
MRRPSMQFYPGDWQANPKLRRCSHAEKGIWLDVLCILHDQDEYGIIRWPLRDLALAVHARPAALQSLADKEVLKGCDSGECEPLIFIPRHGRKDGEPVTLIPAQPGPIWYSSRMVRDEYVRQVRADNEPKVTPKVDPSTAFGAGGRSHPSRERASAAVSSSSSSSSSPSGEKKHPSTKQRDERAGHPAMVAVREIKGQFPSKDVWDLIIKTVGDNPDCERMRECWVAWRSRNYAPGNLAWLVDWYVNGIPNRNGRPQRTKVDVSLESAQRVADKYENRG